MHARTPLPQPLVNLLALQQFVVSREQALEAGLASSAIQRLVTSGRWRRVETGIYVAAPDDTWLRRAWVGTLLPGEGGVLGLESARHLHGLGPQPQSLQVWVGRDSWPSNRSGFEFLRGERRGTGMLPRTSVDDTILDLAGRLDADGLCRLIADAVSERKTTAQQLRRRLEGRDRQSQRGLLADLLTDVGDGVRSPLERRYLINVERAHGLPIGRRQWRDADGLHCDVAYDGLLVELDGTTFHRGARLFDDMNRDNSHLEAGLPTFRFGWPHATSLACDSAELVGRALKALGWAGHARRCAHCRRRPSD